MSGHINHRPRMANDFYHKKKMNKKDPEYKEIPSGTSLKEMFSLLRDHFGPQKWWPADTPFEVIVGAVLTQNTNWKNVEKAIGNLKKKGMLTLEALAAVTTEDLAERIRPSGYYNIKADRLKNLLAFINARYAGDLSKAFSDDTAALRKGLLSVKGIGPETADSIMLYAAKHPVFVIDAYTRRILLRHGLAESMAGYEDLQTLFMDNITPEAGLFNEFHALIVQTGKHYCKKRPLCDECPLKKWTFGHTLIPYACQS